MNNYTKSLTLDIGKRYLLSPVYAKQGDMASRYLKITMMNGDSQYTPASGNTARFRALKPDGNSVMNPATINSDGTITCELTEQTLACAGLVKADVVIMDGTNKALASASFDIAVERAPLGSDLESDNEFAELMNLIEQTPSIIQAGKDATTAAATATTAAATATTAAEKANTAAEKANAVADRVDAIEGYLGYTTDDIVGLQVDFKNKVFKRLGGAEGKTKGTDFDVFQMFGGRKRCNVADSGTITAYYGDENYKEDGSNGQVMVYQPKFYYRVVPLKLEKNSVSGLGYHIRKANYYVSDSPKAGFKLHPAFYDASGNEVEYILFSAYEGSMYDVSKSEYVNDGTNTDTAIETGDLLCSVSGVKPISGLKKALTKTNAETMAANRGSGWHLEAIKATMANTLLMMIEFGTLNSQTALGNGVTSIADNASFNCSSLTGSTAALGNASGAASETINEIGGTETTYNVNGKVSVSYRGVENPWGNILKHIQGINIWGNGTMAGGQPYIADGLSDFGENKHTGNYKAVGFILPNASGYINAFGYGKTEYDWLLMPSEIGGTSALPVGDYTYITPNLNGYRIALLGGGWNSSGIAGASYWNCNSGVGSCYRSFGGRLLYVPTAEG